MIAWHKSEILAVKIGYCLSNALGFFQGPHHRRHRRCRPHRRVRLQWRTTTARLSQRPKLQREVIQGRGVIQRPLGVIQGPREGLAQSQQWSLGPLRKMCLRNRRKDVRFSYLFYISCICYWLSMVYWFKNSVINMLSSGLCATRY